MSSKQKGGHSEKVNLVHTLVSIPLAGNRPTEESNPYRLLKAHGIRIDPAEMFWSVADYLQIRSRDKWLTHVRSPSNGRSL